MASPIVEMEIVGMPADQMKYKTSQVGESKKACCYTIYIIDPSFFLIIDTNGYNPVWSNRFDFDISNPECALIKFVVQDLDVFGDPIDLAQAVIPVPCIKQGYRSIALRNQYSEELELSSLLVHVEIHKVRL